MIATATAAAVRRPVQTAAGLLAWEPAGSPYGGFGTDDHPARPRASRAPSSPAADHRARPSEASGEGVAGGAEGFGTL